MTDTVNRLRDMAHVIDIVQGKAELVMTTGAVIDEAPDEIETLRDIAEKSRSWLSEEDHAALLRAAEQVRLAHTILGSEAMIWLVAGSHLDSAWREIVSRLVNSYWDSYGNVYRPTSST